MVELCPPGVDTREPVCSFGNGEEEYLGAFAEGNIGDPDECVVNHFGRLSPADVVGAAEEKHPVVQRGTG